MTSLERLRLAVALGHTVQGAELRLHSDQSEEIVVSSHPAADIGPCEMRRMVIASSCAQVPDHSGRIRTITCGGSLEDLGGGVFRVLRGGTEQRWIASLLRPEVVSDILDLVGVDGVPADAMHGCLKPDSGLGVTMLVITSNEPRYDHALDEISAQAAASMFVEELVRDAGAEMPLPDPATTELRGGAS